MIDKDKAKKEVLSAIQHLLIEAERGEIVAFAYACVYDPEEHKYGKGPSTSIRGDCSSILLLKGVTILKDNVRDWFVGTALKEWRE